MSKIYCDVCGLEPVTGLCAEHEDERRDLEDKQRARRVARLPALEAKNVRLRMLLRELVEYWDAAMSDDATPEAVMMMEDALRRAREEVE